MSVLSEPMRSCDPRSRDRRPRHRPDPPSRRARTGLKTAWRRPKYVFGIDGLQALHLAMKCADAVLQSAKLKLEWLGQTGDLGMPKFLPALPKPQQDRLEAMVEREATKFWRGVERAHKAKRSRESKGRTPTKAR